MTDTPDPAAIAEAYLQAWNSHEVDAIPALHADRSTFQAHGRTPVIEGIDALRRAFAGVLGLYPGFRAEAHRLLLGPHHWVLDWTLHHAPAGEDPRGLRCVDIVELSPAGLVARKDTFYADRPPAPAATTGVRP